MAQKLNISDIVKTYSARLAGFIRKRVENAEDAEDILQEVFYQLAEADRLMKPIEQLTAWLFTVTRNRITDRYRKKQPDLFAEFYSDEEEEQVVEEFGAILADDQDSPENEYVRTLVWEELEDALEDLPPEQRDVFRWTEFDGKSFKEISEETSEPVNTWISRKRYAVVYLRERLKILYDELIND